MRADKLHDALAGVSVFEEFAIAALLQAVIDGRPHASYLARMIRRVYDRG